MWNVHLSTGTTVETVSRASSARARRPASAANSAGAFRTSTMTIGNGDGNTRTREISMRSGGTASAHVRSRWIRHGQPSKSLAKCPLELTVRHTHCVRCTEHHETLSGQRLEVDRI